MRSLTRNWYSRTANGGVREVDIPATLELIKTKKLKLWKSNFIKYLVIQAEEYGIKKLFVSGYNHKTEAGTKFQDVDFTQYDIVITNPPFSLINEFIAKLIESGVDFLFIAPDDCVPQVKNAPLIMNGKMWFGYNAVQTFVRPDGSERKCGNVHWLTNMPVSYRADWKILTQKYSPDKHPSYLNFNGIECKYVKDIPKDYAGYIGVPNSFLIPSKNHTGYNPEQFEIIGLSSQLAEPITINGQEKKKPGRFYIDDDGTPKRLVERWVIRNRKVEDDDE